MDENNTHRVVIDKAMIYEMRQAGATLREIGNKFGITRERVRQILLNNFGSTRHDLLSTVQISSQTGLSNNRVMRLYKQGIIAPAFEYDIGVQHRIMWMVTTIQVVKEYYDSQHICRVCKKPIPVNRTFYCSYYCQRESYKYKKMST